MSFVEGMRGRGVGVLSVRGGVLPEMRSWTLRGGLGGNVSARVAEVVRAGVGVGAGLVRWDLAKGHKHNI